MLVRPQTYRINRPRPGKILARLGCGYNWHPHRHIKDPIQRIFAHLHYLTDHAPLPVQRRWRQAEARWKARMRWDRAGINDRL